MNAEGAHDRRSPLYAELRRFVGFRWVAGVLVILGALANSTWQGWTELHARAMLLGAAILAFNIIFWVALWRYRPDRHSRAALTALAWVQIISDMLCLTMLVVWTGGLLSPLLGLFVLHMVFTSTLLSPLSAFGAAGVAAAMVSVGLLMAGRWPTERAELLIGLGGMATILLTVHLTNHITQSLRRREVEVSDRNRRIRAILETAADGIVTIDEDSIIVSINPAAQRIFGYAPGELVGEDIRILVPEPHGSAHAGYIAEYRRTGESKIIGVGREVIGRRKNGTVFPLDAAVSVVPLDDGVNYTAIVRDITDRKAAEQRLRDLNDELRRQQQAMVQSEKMAAMGQMAAGVAHEIANPLASMDSLLQLIKRSPEKLNGQTVDTLRAQLERIRIIVRQMTDFAHPDAGGWARVALNEVVTGALEIMRFDHRIRGVKVSCDLSEEVGQIDAIPHALQQVLVNMIINALDALDAPDAPDTPDTPDPARSPRLRLSTRAAGERRIIKIEDNGQGIAAVDLHRIFEPFYTTKPVGKGTGLGLSISFSLISQHGGTCEVRSEQGRGTSFIISLPADRASSNREAAGRGDS